MENRFQNIRQKKILIYGTGKVAENLLQGSLSGFHVVGIIDRVRFDGEMCGIPILMWDDIRNISADVVVIAAQQRYYREIYQRIIERCFACGMKIYGANGEDLTRYFGIGMNPCQDFKLYEKNAAELRQILAGYDVISFDIFDTLIMRKTLEPADVFDLVEMRLRQDGIILKGFKALRRQAELASGGRDIFGIYDILQEMTGWEDDWKYRILDEEIKCEKDVIVGRRAMIDILNYLVELGKKVYLVSDMYLTAELIKDILQGAGVRGYEKILVSCEYGAGKGNGLFEVLRREIGDVSCIHIGDNEEADCRAALRYGLDTYRICSAHDMLRNSSLRYVLGFAENINDKNMIGLVISKLFNDPFSMYHTSGVLKISSWGMAGVTFLAPLAAGYFSFIADKLKRKDYDGILFAARDEYFFKELYDRILENAPEKVPAYYIYSSRKLSIRSGMDSPEAIGIALLHMKNQSPDIVLRELFGLNCFKPDTCQGKSENDSVYCYQREIMAHSQRTRKNYIEYLEGMGIDRKKKYLYCELDGKGTSHYFLSKLFEQEVDSLYITRHHFMDDVYGLDSEAMYHFRKESDEYNSINENTAFFEGIFSAPHPTVEDMDEGGQPVFDEEIRSGEQIDMMLNMQKAIGDFCEEYFKVMYVENESMGRELPVHFLEMFPFTEFVGECKALYRGKLYDEIGHSYLDILPL